MTTTHHADGPTKLPPAPASKEQKPESTTPNPDPSLPDITEILPTRGLVYSERLGMSEALCGPQIMPIKSVTLRKIEDMEKYVEWVNKKARGEAVGPKPRI